jgi:hypothetical protein
MKTQQRRNRSLHFFSLPGCQLPDRCKAIKKRIARSLAADQIRSTDKKKGHRPVRRPSPGSIVALLGDPVENVLGRPICRPSWRSLARAEGRSLSSLVRQLVLRLDRPRLAFALYHRHYLWSSALPRPLLVSLLSSLRGHREKSWN